METRSSHRERKVQEVRVNNIVLSMTISTATCTTQIGSSCACSGGQSLFWSRFRKWPRPIKSSSGQPSQTNQTTVPCCRHCDGEVVINSTNGHLVLITHLLSSSKIRALPRAFYTMMLKGGYTFERYSVALPYKEVDDT